MKTTEELRNKKIERLNKKIAQELELMKYYAE